MEGPLFEEALMSIKKKNMLIELSAREKGKDAFSFPGALFAFLQVLCGTKYSIEEGIWCQMSSYQFPR